jgi:hypothetical protein
VRVRYCPQGHDTLLVGRTTWGYCSGCNRERNRLYYCRNAAALRAKHAAYKATTPGILAEMRHASRRRMEELDAAEV